MVYRQYLQEFGGRDQSKASAKTGNKNPLEFIDLIKMDSRVKTGAITTAHHDYHLFLIENGADVNLPEQIWGSTPLMFATQKGEWEIVKSLINKGAHVHVKNFFSKSTLDLAKDRVNFGSVV